MKESMVYPGEYAILPAVKERLYNMTSAHVYRVIKPRVNIIEKEDSFEIDVLLPGRLREDLFVYVHGSALSLAILVKKTIKEKKQTRQINEVDTMYMQKHIALPGNADPEFMSAEYKQGVLHICIPKTGDKPAAVEKQVIVY